MTVAEMVVRQLKNHGVEFLFGIPGGPSLAYLEACRNEGVQFVLVKNEASAGFMATAYTQLTGKIAACHGTFGPGATNLSTGVGCAYLDRTPLLALTTEMSDQNLGRIKQMNIDHQKIFGPITKWTTRLSPDRIGETIGKAVEIACSEVPGPVHIGLPSNIGDLLVEESPEPFPVSLKVVPDPGASSLAAMKDIFSSARRPVLAVGLSAVRLELEKEIVELAERFDVPVVLTPMAKGMIAEAHRNYLGVLFHALSQMMDSVLGKADLVVGIGYDPIEFNYEEWMPAVPLVHIDSVPADVPDDVDVVNVVGALHKTLNELLGLPRAKKEWDYNEIEAVKQAIGDSLRPKSSRMTPSDVLEELRAFLPAEGIMTCDVGAHTHLIGQIWPTPARRRQLMTNGWSSMGFGVPSAVGAKLAEPDTPVVCVSGDAGFLMNLGELVTARRLGLNIVFVVLNDNDLSLIDVKQQWRKAAKYGVDLYEGGLFESEKLLGAPAYRVSAREGLQEAFSAAFAQEGPAVVEASVDGSVYINLIAKR